MVPWSSPKATTGARSDHPKSVNIFLGFFLVLNTSVGIGFLGIPYGFFYSGFITSILTLLIIAFVTWNNAVWEIETMARAEAVVAFKQSLRKVGEKDNEKERSKENGEFEHNNDWNEGRVGSDTYPNFQIRLTRNFEPTELCEIFFNRWVKYLYILALVTSQFGWTGTVIVGSAWATNIPFDFDTVKQCKSDAFQHHILPTDGECVNAYRLCLLIYAVIIVTLSVIDLKQQAVFQMFFGFMRFAMIGAIVIYCIVSLIEGGDVCIGSYSSNSSSNHTGNLSNASVVTNTSGYFDFSSDFLLDFDWKGWVVSIPVFIYAFSIHYAVPTVTQPIKQKKYLHWLMMLVFGITAVLYLSVGIFVSLQFRGSVQETASLNWVTLSKPGHSPQLRVLSYFIVLFPTLDICTSNPLSYHALANNIYAVFVSQDVGKHRFDWIIRPTLRFLLAVLPIVPALFVSNLVYVLNYTGLCGFATCLVFPTALQLQSQRVCKKLFGDSYRSVAKRSGQQFFEQDENYSITSGRSTETVPLLSVQRKSILDSKQLYMTPYSNKVFSHPIAVGILGTLGITIALLGIISVFVKPDTLHCQAYQ